MKLALVMIVKPSDDEAKVLERCLNSVAEHVDGIFLTITGENAKCENVARMFNAHVSKYKWNHSFADARNFALSQVPKEYDYWMWLDCDDVLRGAEKLKPTIEDNLGVDGFIFNYLYSFDEYKNPVVVHLKTRIIKNDGCVAWVGDLHEDFKENRSVQMTMVKDIEVLHLTDDERIEDSKKRNVVVASKSMKKNPNDPRSYWNTGNSYKADGQFKKAEKAFKKFLSLSKSDDEKYIVHIRLCEIYWLERNFDKALEHISYAIGLKPSYPDAYFMKAKLLFELNKFEDSIEYTKIGLSYKPPIYDIIVYNPREYDYEPLMLLAKCYFLLELPQLALPCLQGCAEIYPTDKRLKKMIKDIEKRAKKADEVLDIVAEIKNIKDKEELKKRLDAIPQEFQNHPAICNIRNINFIKTESSGKDLVFFCGFTEKPWDPEIAARKGVGGSEEAVIHLSTKLAKKGWNVTVYANCGHQEKKFDGVTWRPFWSWNYRDKQDVTILWRSLKMCDYEINSDKIFVDLHDVIMDGEFNEKRLANIDKVFVKSKAHLACFPSLPEEKAVIVPNGIEWDQFNQEIEREPGLIVITSSPDRHLSATLDIVERLQERVPNIRVMWAYGWDIWDVVHGENAEAIKWKQEMIERMNNLSCFTDLGRIGQDNIAVLYQRADVFLYPTAFYEIDCISARKAQASGAFPVTTNFAALNETVKYGFKFNVDPKKENWGNPGVLDYALQDQAGKDIITEEVIKFLQAQKTEKQRQQMRDWTKQFDWEEIATVWDRNLCSPTTD